MSECNNCNPTCYENVSTDCIGYSGPSIPEIGLEQGMSGSKVFEILGNQAKESKESAEKCSCGSSESSGETTSTNIGNVSALQNNTVNSISTSPIKISSTIDQGNIAVGYDFIEAFESLGGTPSSIRVSLFGKYKGSVNDVELGVSDTVTGGFSVLSDSCPLTIKVQSRLLDADGVQKIVEYSKPFPCQSGTTEDFLNASSVGTNSVVDQAGVNTAVCSELEAIKSQMSSILNFSFEGQDINTIVVNQLNTIEILKTDIESLKEEIQSCKDTIDELNRTV